ncbi:hypothetical protein [Flavobacterium sp.]|jgi:hypothetical protein|uniref:hypothetical protein n=1 Tax=Flavobacterium sp. TaxID=239 RepID=UPI0037BF7F35
MRNLNDCLMFVKFTQKKYAEKLINGEIFFNLPTYYNSSDNEEIGDNNEGAEWIDNSEVKSIRAEYAGNKIFNFTPIPNSISKITQYDNYFLSFSLYTIYKSAFNESGIFKVDSKMKNSNYDTAIVIEEPFEFLKRIEEKLKLEKINYEMDSVNYKNLNIGKIDLTPFDKKIEHSHQNEFRIIIENLNNSTKTINIGSIEKLCKIVPSEAIIESEMKVTNKK